MTQGWTYSPPTYRPLPLQIIFSNWKNDFENIINGIFHNSVSGPGRILVSTPYESWDFFWFSPLLLKTIKFIRRHFQARNFNCAVAEVTEANFKTSACLFAFCRRKYFLRTSDNWKFSVFVSKVQKEQGIFLFVHRKLAWELYVLGARSGSLFEILVARG